MTVPLKHLVLVLASLLTSCDAGPAWIFWTRDGHALNKNAHYRYDAWSKLSAHSTRAECIRRFPAPGDFKTDKSWVMTIENKQSYVTINDDGSVIESQYACWPVGVNPEN